MQDRVMENMVDVSMGGGRIAFEMVEVGPPVC